MINTESNHYLKPKRKKSYYYKNILGIILLIGIASFSLKLYQLNEIVFGLIVLIFLRKLYDKFYRKKDDNIFKIENQYDKLNQLIFSLIGIAFITFSIMNSDFMIKLNFEWINFLLLGIIFIVGGLKKRKSLKFITKNSNEIEIEDYTLMLNEEVKEIQLFEKKMIISKHMNKNYVFKELKIDENDKMKLKNWIRKNIPNIDFKITWNDSNRC